MNAFTPTWKQMGEFQMVGYGTSVPYPKPYGVIKLPYVFVGDGDFALKKNSMKPYAQNGLTIEKRVDHYRHSRARRISENLFGIIVNRWQVFRTVLELPPSTTESLVMTALVLHNYLRKSSSRNVYCPAGLLDTESRSGKLPHGLWRKEVTSEAFVPLSVPISGLNATNYAKLTDQRYL